MSDPGVEDLVINLGNAYATSMVCEYLRREPQVASAIRDAHAFVVLFAPLNGRPLAPSEFFESLQRALLATDASIPDGGRAVYIALTSMPEIVRTEAFELTRPGRPVMPFVHLEGRRGRFLGYLAFGEGGVAFFDGAGQWKGTRPPPELVIDALRSPGD